MSVIIFYNCQIDAIKIKGKGSYHKKNRESSRPVIGKYFHSKKTT